MIKPLPYYPATLPEKIGFERIREAARRRLHTPYGREWLDHDRPSRDPDIVEERLAMAREWLNLIQREQSVPLETLNDIRPALKDARLEGSMLSLETFCDLYANARSARLLRTYLLRHADEMPRLKSRAMQLIALKTVEDEIARVVQIDQAALRDDASPELRSIRGKLNRRQSRLRSLIQSAMKQARSDGMASDEGPTIRSGRMVIPIQAEYKRKVKGFVHDVSASGQTVYIEPVAALQTNNEIRELESEEKQEIERILRELTAIVRNHRDAMMDNCDTLAFFDALHAKVSLGLSLDASIPLTKPHGQFSIRHARNPNLLLKQLAGEEEGTIIPLDLELEPDELGLVITGPNAGGKSVAMKTAGLLCWMAQAGYPIPADPSTELTVLSGLFVDVGDDQSIENDLSTFSSRLQWMKYTLEHAAEGALVLIDEAGAGTDPEEGGALFQAFAETMISRGARIIITTHHGSLKVFADLHKQAVNGAMEFDQTNLSPTYRFKKGVPGSSYAFEIAARMELGEPLLGRARNLLGENRDAIARMLINLEKKTQQAEENRTELETLRERAAGLEEKLSARQSEIEKEHKKIVEKAYREADRIMQTANKRIEQAVEKIVQSGNEDKEMIREARREIEETKQAIRRGKADIELSMQDKKKGKKPEKGDFVTVGESGSTGEVVAVKGNQITVLVNGMKIKAKLSKVQVTKPPGKSKDRQTRSYGGSDSIDLDVKPRLDLRGKRGDEAIRELTHHIDKAVVRGLPRLEIIHGKGDGILKKLVHEHLASRSEIASFELAPVEQGGAGCTYVELR